MGGGGGSVPLDFAPFLCAREGASKAQLLISTQSFLMKKVKIIDTYGWSGEICSKDRIKALSRVNYPLYY